MINFRTIAVFAFIIFLISCSAANKSTGVWVNTDKIKGKSFSKIFIVVMTADVDARVKIETDLAAAATAKGYASIKSMDVNPPSLQNPAAPTKDEIAGQVKSNGCDAVFIASLLKEEEDVRYTPGTTAYSIRPYYSWHGNLWGYYNHWYPSVSTSGYYTKEKSYFMQSNLYDAASEEIMWSVQSEIFNPASVSKFSKSYTSVLVKQLENEGLLKK
jgi:hypothetical protein